MANKVKSKSALYNSLLLSLLVFAVYQIMLLPALHILNFQWFNPLNWSKWDTGHYLEIAKEGYTYFSCAGLEGFPDSTTHMCGSAGWFPGYSYILKLFHPHANLVLVGSILSKLFFLSTLFMSTILLKIKRFSLNNFILVMIVAFWFGSIYYQAIFPISATITFVFLAFISFQRNSVFGMAICSFATSFMYSTGFLLPIALGLAIVINKNESINLRIKKAAIINIAGALAVFSFFLILHIQVDEWKAFINVQKVYGHGFESPLKQMGIKIGDIPRPFFQINNLVYLQSALVLLTFLFSSILFFRRRMYKKQFYLLIYIYSTLYLFFPWSVGGGALSMYRAESLLLPIVFLFADLNKRWLIVLLIVQVSVWIPMSYLFFNATLV